MMEENCCETATIDSEKPALQKDETLINCHDSGFRIDTKLQPASTIPNLGSTKHQ
jgi:hypothetical protein